MTGALSAPGSFFLTPAVLFLFALSRVPRCAGNAEVFAADLPSEADHVPEAALSTLMHVERIYAGEGAETV